MPTNQYKLNINLNQQYKAKAHQMNTNQHEQSLNHHKPVGLAGKSNLLVFHTDAVVYIVVHQ